LINLQLGSHTQSIKLFANMDPDLRCHLMLMMRPVRDAHTHTLSLSLSLSLCLSL